MTNKLRLFQNEEFGKIRALEIDSAPWFVGKDVAMALGYGNTKDALKSHVDAEDKRIIQRSENATLEIPNRGLTFINESGLYSLILSSKLPKAKAFKRWVTSEVLPSIRKFGTYATEETLRKALGNAEYARDLMAAMLEEEMHRSDTLQCRVRDFAPKARYYDIILQNKGAVQISIIAKDYGMSAVAFNRLLHDAGVQHKIGKTWLLYQKYSGLGYTLSRTYPVNDYTVAIHTYWTQKGRLFLYNLLKEHGVIPQMEAQDAAACY